jgi:hypothetical protein
MDGKTQAAAAAASGMSLRTAREWAAGPVPSATKRPRDWRTRPDPFATVWTTDVEPLLRSDVKGVLEAKWVLEVLQTRYPEAVSRGAGPDAAAALSRLAGATRRRARGVLRASRGPWA